MYILIRLHQHCTAISLLLIFIGQCTSYFISGNVIQENWGTDCSKFKENACPIHYRSDEAHKCKC